MLRLLLPFTTGILLQWHLQPQLYFIIFIFIGSFSLLILFFLLSAFRQFRQAYLSGCVTSLLLISLAAIITWQKDTRNHTRWAGHHYQENDGLRLVLDEIPVEKTKSLKANASITHILRNEKLISVNGRLIIYFKKDSTVNLDYGSCILINKPLQPISNSGNPGSFDYKRYCLFNGITHQVYLEPGEFIVQPGKKQQAFTNLLCKIREWVLSRLRTNLHNEQELGLAEALLIGYKDDLDKSLVQSYTNTGVVHIIAISGLHLGLIYWLLLRLFAPLRKTRQLIWLRPLLIIAGLWLFSLLAGAQPSVLRSALMFTCIVAGEGLSRKTSIFNTLALSAFLLLCYNPFWLWDLGFQLSYTAVLSLIIFMKPVYNCAYFKYKFPDLLWKMNAVTIAAQILTIPISIFHFHQFPNYFLLTNFVAIPLSSAILIGEILLCCISFIPVIAAFLGTVLGRMISLMNDYVQRIEAFPFAIWQGLHINLAQTLLLYLFIVLVSYALTERSRNILIAGLIALLGFVSLRSISFLKVRRQQKIIVYHIPQRSAIDFIAGASYYFRGDTDLAQKDFIRNFYLQPARTMHRTTASPTLANIRIQGSTIQFGNIKILFVDTTVHFSPSVSKNTVDLLLISRNPKINLRSLMASFDIRQVILDGSVPNWKIPVWKKQADSLHIPIHVTNEKGAFVMKLR